VIDYYHAPAQAALRGALVYRDFESSYSPLFAYVLAPAVWLWNSPKSIMLLAVFIEAAAVWVWLKIARRLLDRDRLQQVLIAATFSSVPWLISATTGQNQMWIALFVGLSFLLQLDGRSAASGLVYGVGFLCTKFLILLFGPVLLFSARHRVRWLVSAGILPIVVYGALFAAGADFLMPLRAEAADVTSGNLPYLVTAFGMMLRDPATSGALILILVGVIAAVFVCYSSWKDPGPVLGRDVGLIALLTLVLLVFSKKAYTGYLTIAYVPMLICLAQAWPPMTLAWVLSLYNLVAALEPSLWFRWTDKAMLGDVIAKLPEPRAAAFILCEIVLVSCHIGFASRVMHSLPKRTLAADKAA
jgi:hypothetical protein